MNSILSSFPLSPLAALLVIGVVGLSPQVAVSRSDGPDAGRALVYFGTYTGGDSQGIYLGELDLASGKLELRGVAGPGIAGKIKNPSFLAIHPNHRFLYAVSEVEQTSSINSGAVAAFSINPASGRLTLLNQESSAGRGPCHLSVDHAGKNVLVANYGSGTVGVLPIGADGRLKPPSDKAQHSGNSAHPDRQKGPHAHCVVPSPDYRFAMVVDLGIDQIVDYRLDHDSGMIERSSKSPTSLSPGAGPRHLAFHPSGKWAYVINELSSTVTAFTYKPEAEESKLEEFQSLSTLPEGFAGSNTTAEVQVHPSGKFLYGSNRGHDSIAMYSIDVDTGRLTPLGQHPAGGRTPRNFGIDPTGKFLLSAHQDSNTVVVHRVDPATGRLEKTEHAVEIPSPVCVKFLVR